MPVDNAAPSYLTSPEEALARTESLEDSVLAEADRALAAFLERVVKDASDGQVLRGSVVGYWLTEITRALSHPRFAEIRDELVEALEEGSLADDAYSAAEMALEIAANMGATADERRAILNQLFPRPTEALVASLSERVDGWLRRVISKRLTRRIGRLGPDDLTRDDLVGAEFDYPSDTGGSTNVTEADWREDDRPGDINWRARMQRDVRTAYTRIFGRQMQRQIERYGFPEKRWVSRKDERTRLSHRHADGDVVGVYESFRVGRALLRFPGDPTGPANETINCRCVLVASGPRRP